MESNMDENNKNQCLNALKTAFSGERVENMLLMAVFGDDSVKELAKR